MKNEIRVCGKLIQFNLSHAIDNVQFYKGVIAVKRKSQFRDFVPFITVKPDLQINTRYELKGHVHTRNWMDEHKATHKSTYVMAQSVELTLGEDYNNFDIEGVLVNVFPLRETPMGRTLCDLVIAINGSRAYYPNCIAWEYLAGYAQTLKVGQPVHITGRFQSREYNKQLETGKYESRMAYELSLNTLKKEEV